MNMIQPRQIAGMQVGPDLDKQVNALVFGEKTGRPKAYSTTDKCMQVMIHAKLAAGEMHPQEPAYKADKPYFAQSQDKSVTVIAATLPSAICKAACIQAIEVAKSNQ